MIIYLIEIDIDCSMQEEWIKWMKKKHIPDIMNTKLFTQYSFLKEINFQNKYIIQYKLENIENLIEYETKFSTQLKEEHNEKFKGKFTAKREVLQEIIIKK